MRTHRFHAPWAPAFVGCLTLVLASGGVESRARAQPGRQWLVVPSTVADGGDVSPFPRRTAELLEAQLPSGDVTIIPARQARARFEQRGSSAPMMATHSDLDALARDAQQALYHVASGLPSRARQDVERALARAGNVIESLNRETRAAQHLLDACLYMVRAQLESGQRDEAREQALQCRRLVPDIEPDGTMHPPDVIGVLAEAEAHLRQREPGSLRVESAPSGCAVYVNGRMLGTSPLELSDLGPGEYRVQVECREGQPGRVHRVVLAAGRVVKRIDTRFDSMLQTAIDTSLRYPSHDDQARWASDHAAEIGRVVGASDVVLVSQLAADPTASPVLLIRRIQVADGKVVAAVKVALDPEGTVTFGHQGRALAGLRNAHFTDLTKADATELAEVEYAATHEDTEPSAAVAQTAMTSAIERAPEADAALETTPSSERQVDRSPSVFGWVLGAAGVATFVTGWSLYGYQLTLEADYHAKEAGSDAYYSALQDVDSFEFVPQVTTLVGAALTSASLPLVLPEHNGVPAWSLLAGGVGLVTAGVGAYFAYAGTQCNEFDAGAQRCSDSLLVTYFGYMVLFTAAPLITIPVVYMTRGTSVADSRVSLQASSQGASLSWTGVM